MDVRAVLADPFLRDALDAAATDADSIHHDLCPGALIPGRLTGRCSCGVPELLRQLSAVSRPRPARA